MSSIMPYTFPETGTFSPPNFDGEPIIKGLEAQLYVVEYDAGGIKVGYTANPARRLNLHRRNARNFGRRAVRGVLTGPHIEATANERALIKACRLAAKVPADHAGEYFPLSLDEVVLFIEAMPQTRGDRELFEEELKRRSHSLFGSIFPQAVEEPKPQRFGPVFPWAKHLDVGCVDEFVQQLRDALEEPNPLAAIDHVAADWAAEFEGGAR